MNLKIILLKLNMLVHILLLKVVQYQKDYFNLIYGMKIHLIDMIGINLEKISKNLVLEIVYYFHQCLQHQHHKLWDLMKVLNQ